MTLRRTTISFLLFFFSLAAGPYTVSAQVLTDRSWNVKTVCIDTSQAYCRMALPSRGFDPEKVKTVDKYFTARTVRGLFNGVVLFAQGDRVFTKAYGYAEFRTREKLAVSSRFQLASISKTLTGTAIAMLASQGLIDVEAPVSTYLEGFPYPKMTVAMLLSHTSGIADYLRFSPGAWASTQPMSNEDLLAIICKRKPKSYFAAGAMYRYSNTNYAILASILEHVTGELFSQWVHRNIFNPAGMKDTFFCTDSLFRSAERMTTGHTSRRGPYSQNFLDGVLGDKGVYSTVEDLLRFDLALRGGFLLDTLWQRKAYTNYTDSVHPYGWGWRLYHYLDYDIIYHNGWWHGYKGRFVRIPDKEITIIVLENQARSSFSIPALINIGEKLFDLPPDETEQHTEGQQQRAADPPKKG